MKVFRCGVVFGLGGPEVRLVLQLQSKEFWYLAASSEERVVVVPCTNLGAAVLAGLVLFLVYSRCVASVGIVGVYNFIFNATMTAAVVIFYIIPRNNVVRIVVTREAIVACSYRFSFDKRLLNTFRSIIVV